MLPFTSIIQELLRRRRLDIVFWLGQADGNDGIPAQAGMTLHNDVSARAYWLIRALLLGIKLNRKITYKFTPIDRELTVELATCRMKLQLSWTLFWATLPMLNVQKRWSNGLANPASSWNSCSGKSSPTSTSGTHTLMFFQVRNWTNQGLCQCQDSNALCWSSGLVCQFY